MVTVNVIKAVQDVLQKRGIEQRPNEPLSDYVSRGLGASDAETEAFLQYVHDGMSGEEAAALAGIREENVGSGLLTDVARAIGTALGKIAGTV